MDERKEFLMKMYDQMFNDIDRHHKIVWETMGVLIGAFAVLALVEKNVISLDMATSLIILLSSWVIVHVYDSNYWYFRNLIIIANIEKQFLNQSDTVEIHAYFREHRSENSMQTSLKIQLIFCIAVIFLFLIYHFSHSIYPGFKLALTLENIRIEKIIPYVSGVIGCFVIIWIKNKRKNDYKSFLKLSPGKTFTTLPL